MASVSQSPTPTRWSVNATWIVMVVCGFIAAMHLCKLPSTLTEVQAYLTINLVQAGLLLGLVQLGMSLCFCQGIVGVLAEELRGSR